MMGEATYVFARFIWREPGTKKPYDIAWISNLAFVPRVDEEVTLIANSSHLHSFDFVGTFVVEKVKYRLATAPDAGENISASRQEIVIYVQPVDKRDWKIVQQIKKEYLALGKEQGRKESPAP